MQPALPAPDNGLTARERLFMASLLAMSGTILQQPLRITESAWLGHIPFAFWIMKVAQPQILVELGTHRGASFAAFCQQASKNLTDCHCYAIDTWKGDDQAGFYGEEVYSELLAFINQHYEGWAHLVRAPFDEAVGIFDDNSIDLLHIDGYHSKEAILHDFETWLPKMSKRGIVLMHDINARMPGYGGFDAWQEISRQYPVFDFAFASGLGVVLVGSEQPYLIRELANLDEEAKKLVRTHFSHAGKFCKILLRQDEAIRDYTKIYERRIDDINTAHAGEYEGWKQRFSELEKQIVEEQGRYAKLGQEKRSLEEDLGKQQERIDEFLSSNSWRMTEPLRQFGRLVRKMLKISPRKN